MPSPPSPARITPPGPALRASCCYPSAARVVVALGATGPLYVARWAPGPKRLAPGPWHGAPHSSCCYPVGAPADQVFDLLGERVGGQQPGEQFGLGGGRAEGDGDRDVVVGPVLDHDRIAGLDRARRDHPQVGAGPGGLGEPPDPARPAEPALEGAARDPRAADLEQHLVADPPALADQRVVDGHALGGQVLAEDAVAQPHAQLGLPPVEIFPRVGVHGLVVAAVVSHVVDPVAGQADGPGALRAGRGHLDGPAHRPLVDAGERDRLPRVVAGRTDIDREQPHISQRKYPCPGLANRFSGRSRRPLAPCRYLLLSDGDTPACRPAVSVLRLFTMRA